MIFLAWLRCLRIAGNGAAQAAVALGAFPHALNLARVAPEAIPPIDHIFEELL